MVSRGMVTLITTKQMLPSITPPLRHRQTATRGLLVGLVRTETASVRENFNSAMLTGKTRSQALPKGAVDGEPLTERMAKNHHEDRLLQLLYPFINQAMRGRKR